MFLFLISLFPFVVRSQTNPSVTISGMVKDAKHAPVPYANVAFKLQKNSSFIMGALTNDEVSLYQQKYAVGELSNFLDLGTIILQEDAQMLNEVAIIGTATAGVSDNDKVAVLIDGEQNAVTGFGSQTGLDNILASAIERIEIINRRGAGNETFRKTFVVYSTDQVEARYILTPALMERICKLNDLCAYTVSLSFIDSRMYIAFPLDTNHFEPPVFTSLLKPGVLDDDLNMLQFIYNIVEELDLNTRIWTKR